MFRTLYSPFDIIERLSWLSEKIVEDYESKNPVFLVVLKGGMFFASSLMQTLPPNFACSMETVVASSYEDSTSRVKDVQVNFQNKSNNWGYGRHIVILDDVADTFNTLHVLMNHHVLAKSQSVKSCVLIDKPIRREINATPDYYAIRHEEDDFLVGYGMGVGEKFRHLNYIGAYDQKFGD